MSEPPADPAENVVYLDVDDALEIFGAIIGGTATQAAAQLRHRAALAGALARPINHAQYENADLALQAATLAHGIAETQPFIDGNKRAALVVMLTFLEINGSRVQASDRELAVWRPSPRRGRSRATSRAASSRQVTACLTLPTRSSGNSPSRSLAAARSIKSGLSRSRPDAWASELPRPFSDEAGLRIERSREGR